MPMYNLIEYNNAYSQTSRRIYTLTDDGITKNLPGDSALFKSKVKITGKNLAGGKTKDVKIAVLLKYLPNFWRTLEIPLINCEINLNLTWSSTCVITNSTDAGIFVITDSKRYVPVVTL